MAPPTSLSSSRDDGPRLATDDRDEALRSAVERTTGRRVVDLQRSVSIYSTSYPLEDVTVELEDGSHVDLLHKDVNLRSMMPGAQFAKPKFVLDPGREIAVYEHLLPLGRPGPPLCYGSGETWVLIEKILGVELYQVDADGWAKAAAWLGGAHRAFAEVLGSDDGAWWSRLLAYDAPYFEQWPERARWTLADSEHASWAEALCRGYDKVVDRLTSMPSTVIHGDLYASNVLIAGGRVAPVDWEMAGIGPSLLDLASLVAGDWPEPTRKALVDAYAAGVDGADLDACRLHIAIQWLGWCAGWVPEEKHRHDWLADAMELSERLGAV